STCGTATCCTAVTCMGTTTPSAPVLGWGPIPAPSHSGALSDPHQHQHWRRRLLPPPEGGGSKRRRFDELMCARLSVPPESVVLLEDAMPSISTAHSLCIYAILYRDTAQTIADIHACLQGTAERAESKQ